jgi:hypothetical protein
MTNTQLFLSLLGVLVALFGSQIIMVKMYVDAKIDGKIDPLSKQVDLLVQYMIAHEGKIAVLEDRSKGKP